MEREVYKRPRRRDYPNGIAGERDYRLDLAAWILRRRECLRGELQALCDEEKDNALHLEQLIERLMDPRGWKIRKGVEYAENAKRRYESLLKNRQREVA